MSQISETSVHRINKSANLIGYSVHYSNREKN